ncbi:T9SS type A sorting domain-containing protein [Pontibacter sp. KCTC 32443]|uniref:Ig-like domain-containing protein n=1 Tax=Pontibacter TaxID=323449 RepID=UPI00164E5E2E|nr:MULTISPECIES: T9SS type A sorting domain-containing protein [Pontibacter]MBC5773789.1 T9SS type A sorting domain-containing protein [Pontibacter sp. KCTC 32443]
MKKNFTKLISEFREVKHFTIATTTLLLLIISAAYLRAAVGITVTGVNPISVSADLAANSTTTAYTTLGTINFRESANTEFGTNNTIDLNAPSGWEFYTTNPTGITLLGRETDNSSKTFTVTVSSITASKISIFYNGAVNNKIEEIIISGIRIRALDGATAPETVAVTAGGALIFSNSSVVQINHTNGAAKKIVFGQQPSNVLTGNSITPSPTIIIQDQFNNIVTSGAGSTAQVSIAIGNNPSGSNGILSGGGPVAAVNGIATFSGLSIDAAGTGYTLTASSGTLTGVTSAAFNVNSKTPTLSTLPANCITEGSGDYTITLTGTNFEKNSVGQVNGQNRATTFVSATQVQVVLLASDLATAGDISITVQNPGPPALITSNPQTLNVKPSFSNATIAGDRTVCAGKDVVFTAPAGFTDYTWSATAGSGTFASTGSANETRFTPGIDASGAVTITASAKNICGTSGTVTFNIDVLPAPPVTINYTGSTAICEGSSIVLNAPAAPNGETYTYQWFNGSTAVGSNSETFTATTAGSYTVTVAAANGCARTSAPVTVTVNPLPVAAITPDGPITFCQGGSVTLTASNGSSWLWSNGATTQSITVDADGTFTVQVTDGNSCTSSASEPVTVTVNPIPAAPTVTGGEVCDQGEVTLGATVGENGNDIRWYTAATGGSPVATGNTYTTPTITSTTTFYASSYNTTTGCESERVAVVATVNPLPTVSITPTGPLQFCEGNSVVLVPTALPDTDTFTYEWFNAADNAQVGTAKDYVATTSGDYYLVVTNQNGCQQTSETLTVIVAEIPTEANITLTGSSTFCQGGSVKMSANKSPDPENPYTYKWFKNGSEIESASSESFTASESGEYQVEVTNLVEGCAKMSAKVVVNVLPQPIATITSTNEQKCLGAGNTTSFTVLGDFSGGTAQWLSSNSNYVISNPVYNATTGKATATVTATGTGSGTITLRTTNNASNCTTANSTVTLTVNPLPTADITAGGPTTFCQGGSVVLSAPQGVNYVYQWFRNGSTITTGGTDRDYTATTAGNYTVKVTNSVTGCTTTSATATTITVNPQPIVTASAPVAAKCVGENNTTVFDLTGTATNGTPHWSVVSTTGSATLSNFSSPNTGNTQATIAGIGTVTVRLTSSSTVAGCTDATKDITLNVYPYPTANAGPDQTLCAGATFTRFWRQASGSGSEAGNQVKWTVKSTDPGVSVTNLAYPWIYNNFVDITGVGSAVLTMTVTTNGCLTSDDVVYTVKPTPVITAIEDKTYCNGAAGSAINFESSVAGSTITWTSSKDVGFGTSGTGNIGAYAATNTTTSNLTTTVTVNASVNGCPAAQKSFTITVYPTPKLTGTLTPAAICSGTAFTYNATVSPGGAVALWSRAAVTGISNAAATGTGSINETLTNTTTTDKVVTYVYTITANGCSNTQNVVVTVKPKPDPAFTGVTEGQVFYSGDGTVTLTGQNPSGGTFSGPGVSGTTFNPCNAFNGVPASTTTVTVPITYTVTVAGCTNSITKNVTVKRSTYRVVVTAIPMPFCRGDNVQYTTKIYRDITSIVYPYLVDDLGRPIYENGSFVPPGSGSFPVANPNYPFPAGTPDIIKAMAYRFFEPIVTGGTLVNSNDFEYQWHKNEKVERKNDGTITTDAGLSSMDYYGVYVTSKNSSACVPTLSSQLSDRKYSAEMESYTSMLTANPICQVGIINFTATLDSSFPYWSIANLQVELVRERGSLVLATAAYAGSNTFNFAVNTANVDLVNGDKVYVRFNSILDQYRAQSKCAGRPNSNAVTIQIDQPAAITANLNPIPAQCEAGNVTLSVTATGSNLQYAWYKEGSATPLANITGKISGATTNAITISNLALTDAGKYYVTVSNGTTSACSSTVTSNITELLVNPLTRITTQPQGLTVCSGSPVSFSAAATGTNVAYQWYKGTTLIPGATSPTYSIPSAVAADAGDYTVRVTGTCGVLTSTIAPLVVNEPVVASANMSAATQCQGTTVNMSVNATGTGLVYEWFKDGVSIGNNTNSLSIASAQTSHNGEYTVKVSGTCTPTPVVINLGTLTVEPTVVPTGQMTATHEDGRPITDADPVKLNETAVFTVNSTYADNGDATLYMWYVGSQFTDTWTQVQSGTSNVYKRLTVSDEPYEVKVVISGRAGECYSTLSLPVFSNLPIKPLPVEIIYLRAEKQGNNVVIQWATAMEENNEGFEVQVSQDGRTYRKLDFVATRNGNTSLKQTYEFVDKEDGKYGTRYYRLKQMDTDGKFTYFGPKMVTFGNVSNNILAYPNPFTREVKLDVEAEKDGMLEITVTNIMGKKVTTKLMEVAQGKTTVTLDLGESLPSGIYIVTTRVNGRTDNFKLLKQ